MAPDFHYFFKLGPHRGFSHSVKGAFLFALPASLAVLWVFQTVMKVPLISLASQHLQEKLVPLAKPFAWSPGERFLLILVSLLVGIGTHLVWDSITHERGLVVRNFPDLRAPALDEFGSERPLYNILQHASTLVGMALIVLWYLRWVRRAPVQPVPPGLRMSKHAKMWIAATILTVSIGTSLAYGYSVWVRSHHQFPLFVGNTAITFMSMMFSATLVYALCWQVRTWWLARRQIASSGVTPQRG